jgi:hypothetical protein
MTLASRTFCVQRADWKPAFHARKDVEKEESSILRKRGDELNKW